MSAVAEPRHRHVLSWAKILGGGIVVLVSLALFAADALRYLFTGSTLLEATVPWPRHGMLFVHVFGGSLVLCLGIFQLWSGFSSKAARYHPIVGRVYCAAVLVGSIGAFLSTLSVPEAFSPDKVFAVTAPLFASMFAWLLTTGMAFYAIKKRNIEQHKEWMLRSYVLTFFAFIGVRVIGFAILPAVPVNLFNSYTGFLFWMFSVWLPVLGVDVYLQFTKIRRGAAARLVKGAGEPRPLPSGKIEDVQAI
jgi:uncharacterized membrane protein